MNIKKIYLAIIILILASGCATNNASLSPQPVTVVEFKLGSFEEFPAGKVYTTKDKYQPQVYLHEEAVLNASHIKSSKAVIDLQVGGYNIIMKLNEKGTQLLADITTENIGKVFAILVNDEVVIAPIIHSSIMEGTFMISGIDSEEEANDLNAKILAAINK